MQNAMPNVSEGERKTMADIFHDVLGASPVSDEAPFFAVPKPSG